MRTFKVSDVEPIVEAPLTAVDLPTSLEYRVQSGVEAAGSNQHSFVQCRLHPLIEAAHLAFDLHLPLTFSPDDVWTCIAQGFGIHVDLHAEELRRRLVAHTGKIVIGVRRDDFLRGASANDWAGVVNEISGQLQTHLGPTADLVVANFSTTGPVESMASQIALMSAMQAYFGYELYTFCGIPSITLLGDVDDWKSIRRRVVALGDFELGRWVRSLIPILDQFVASAEGQIDSDFWRSLYKNKSESGEGRVTGWINAFFPYLREARSELTEGKWAQELCWNPHMDDWQISAVEAADVWVGESQFPSGLSRAPFTWHYYESQIPMELLGGFVGISQDPRTLAIRPAIGWAIRDHVDADTPKGDVR